MTYGIESYPSNILIRRVRPDRPDAWYIPACIHIECTCDRPVTIGRDTYRGGNELAAGIYTIRRLMAVVRNYGKNI